jgi:hypothetical protein
MLTNLQTSRVANVCDGPPPAWAWFGRLESLTPVRGSVLREQIVDAGFIKRISLDVFM